MDSSSFIPSEIMADILSRLPVAPLLRFKSVAKSWYFLIKSSTFIKLHLTRSLTQTQAQPNPRHVIISYNSLSSAALDHPVLSFAELDHPLMPVPKEDTLNYFPEPSGLELLGSCNGVVCVSNATKTRVVLFCSATRTHIEVAPSHVPYPEDYVVFGFGYCDGEFDDYKLVRIIQCRERHCHVKFYNEAKVYSLRDARWKWVADLPHFLLYKNAHGVLVGQCLHFIVEKDATETNTKALARFDLKNEGFSLIDLPDFDDQLKISKLVLRELGGCLCVMANYRSGSYVDLWSMRVYGKKESWVKLFSVEMTTRFKEVKPVAYSTDGGYIMLLIDNCELQWCKLSEGSKRFKLVRGFAMRGGPYDAGVYVDSLVSLRDWDFHALANHKNKDDLGDFLSVGFKLRL